VPFSEIRPAAPAASSWLAQLTLKICGGTAEQPLSVTEIALEVPLLPHASSASVVRFHKEPRAHPGPGIVQVTLYGAVVSVPISCAAPGGLGVAMKRTDVTATSSEAVASIVTGELTGPPVGFVICVVGGLVSQSVVVVVDVVVEVVVVVVVVVVVLLVLGVVLLVLLVLELVEVDVELVDVELVVVVLVVDVVVVVVVGVGVGGGGRRTMTRKSQQRLWSGRLSVTQPLASYSPSVV
jgi:hypothetical protein